MKYKTLAELCEAWDSGRLSKNCKMQLDETYAAVYENGECVYYEKLSYVEAFKVIGIPLEEQHYHF